MASLYDIAPRLARARDQRRWELDCDGGEDYAKIISASYRVDRCEVCGGESDTHLLRRRLLRGCNTGHVTYDKITTCRRCGRGMSSHR